MCGLQRRSFQVVQDVPLVINKLRKTNSKDSIDFLVKFAELIHTLIYLHPGFPDLYDPVLTALEVLVSSDNSYNLNFNDQLPWKVILQKFVSPHSSKPFSIFVHLFCNFPEMIICTNIACRVFQPQVLIR